MSAENNFVKRIKFQLENIRNVIVVDLDYVLERNMVFLRNNGGNRINLEIIEIETRKLLFR